MEVKSDGVDEDMKDDVDSVRGLLDRLKQEKERELRQAGSSSVTENGILTDSKQDDMISELQKKQTSLVMNLKSVVKTKETAPKPLQGDETTQHETGDNSKKRKQNAFLAEVQERAEVISKSARKGPETVVSSLAQNTEDDPDTEEFLKKIRAAPSASSEVQIITEDIETRVQRRKSASEVDLSVVVSNSSQLNFEPQKSKISVGRSRSLKERRKPTVEMRRRSIMSTFTDNWDDSINEGEESMDEEESGVGSSGGSFIIKDPPRMGAGGEVRPRSRPKPKVKSQTVAGIALPGLAEVLNKRNMSKDDVVIARPIRTTASESQRPQASAAEIVRAAAEGKKNQVAKEERAEPKEPEKPAWLVEAEARRKLHEQRRHHKAKQHDQLEKEQDKPLNGVILRPVALRSEPEEDDSGVNGVTLRSVAPRSEAEVGKSEGSGVNRLHNVMLRPVRKPEPVPTKSEDDNAVSRAGLNIRLRPVSKPEPVVTQSHEDNESDNIKLHNFVLRPVKKPEPAVNNDKTEESNGRFQNVRLRPIVCPMEPKVADLEKNSSDVTTPSKPSYSSELRSSGSSATETEEARRRLRASSEATSSNNIPSDKRLKQSFSHTGTSSRVYENGETSPGVIVTAKTSPEHHVVRSLAPITSEKPTVARSEPRVSEDAPSRTSRVNGGGSKVTVSSNYVSVPYKLAPKTESKPSNRSKTVTVTASEVPDPSSARKKSVELIHTKVEWRGTSSALTPGNAVSRNARSHADLSGSRKGSDPRDRSETFGTSYRPTYTGDVLPQWKIDLLERKRNVTALPARPQPAQTSNSVVLPLWKKELAEKRKQRVEVNGVQMNNKENERKTSPEIPQWKKEIAERRKRQMASPKRIQPEKVDRSPEIPEWKKKLASTRRAQPMVIPRGPMEDPADQVPSFMKEFEKKKRAFPRGGNNASYV